MKLIPWYSVEAQNQNFLKWRFLYVKMDFHLNNPPIHFITTYIRDGNTKDTLEDFSDIHGLMVENIAMKIDGMILVRKGKFGVEEIM